METMNKKYFGKRIQLARKEQKLTSEKLAELCSINSVYMRKIEAGEKVPSMAVFLKICEVLKVTPNYLLAETLTELEIPNTEQLTELINNATPLQMKLITTMLQSALDALKDT